MKVAFRVDASTAIGLGHLKRCLSLAHAVNDLGGSTIFIWRKHDYDCAGLLESCGQLHLSIAGNGDDDFANDVRQTADALSTFAPDWVVVDHYGLGEQWHDQIVQKLYCRIAVIDDLADRNLGCNLLIDHNLNAENTKRYQAKTRSGTKMLLGPRFALLDGSYASAARYTFHEHVQSIGVFMGGTDLGNHSIMVLDALDAIPFSGPVEVASTTANPALCELRARVLQRPLTTLSVDLPNLAAFFASHDLQIGSGGGAMWERCCIGAPTFALIVADNQNATVPILSDLGIVASLGDEPASSGAVAAALRPLISPPKARRALAENSRQIVDGLGAKRVAMALMSENMTLRAANEGDVTVAYQWRNHVSTRSVSRDSTEINWSNHVTWFFKALESHSRRLFVGEIGSVAIGFIRLDEVDDTMFEVSLYLDPDLHGLGLGKGLLLLVEAKAISRSIIDAEILDGNAASSRLFQCAGYAQYDDNRWRKVLKRQDR